MEGQPITWIDYIAATVVGVGIGLLIALGV